MKKTAFILALLLSFCVAPAFADDGDINFNSASVDEMMSSNLGILISQDLAEAIVAYRTANGPFTSEDALRNVPGMDAITFGSIDPGMDGDDLYFFAESAPAMSSY